ncbi:MAG: MgtC/SapB family protein [Acidimicrobiia bacterium]
MPTATAITAAVSKTSPQALAGVVRHRLHRCRRRFIGAGVVVHGQNEFIRGITTASAIFATAAIGVVVGTGHLALGVATAGAVARSSKSATSRSWAASMHAATRAHSATTTTRPSRSEHELRRSNNGRPAAGVTPVG